MHFQQAVLVGTPVVCVLGLSPSLNTCLFECETVQGALTTSSPVLREAEKAALPFSVACRMGNLLV